MVIEYQTIEKILWLAMFWFLLSMLVGAILCLIFKKLGR